MRAGTLKFILLLFIVIIAGGSTSNQGATIFVETENSKQAALRNFKFGLIKTVKQGEITKKKKSSSDHDLNRIYGGDYFIQPKNEIPLIPGTKFGAHWLIPPLDPGDEIILTIQVGMPKPAGNRSSEDSTINASFPIKISSENRTNFFFLELEPGDAPGNYKVSVLNKGQPVASNLFVIK